MTAVPAVASQTFKVGDLLKFKEGSWWVTRSAGFRNDGKPYSPDSLVLVIRYNGRPESGFFYGRVCSDNEEHLWSYEEFELVSSF